MITTRETISMTSPTTIKPHQSTATPSVPTRSTHHRRPLVAATVSLDVLAAASGSSEGSRPETTGPRNRPVPRPWHRRRGRTRRLRILAHRTEPRLPLRRRNRRPARHADDHDHRRPEHTIRRRRQTRRHLRCRHAHRRRRVTHGAMGDTLLRCCGAAPTPTCSQRSCMPRRDRDTRIRRHRRSPDAAKSFDPR